MAAIEVDRMPAFEALLRARRDAIAQHWLDAALTSYPQRAATSFRQQSDRFANPVGYHLRIGIREMVDDLLGVGDGARAERALHEIVRIRAVQQFAPSEALRFVVDLKDCIRLVCGPDIDAPAHAASWAALQRRIDQLALTAFDIYTAYREHVCQLRINDVKRNVSRIWERMNRLQDSEDSA